MHNEEISYLAVIGRMVVSYALGAPPWPRPRPAA